MSGIDYEAMDFDAQTVLMDGSTPSPVAHVEYLFERPKRSLVTVHAYTSASDGSNPCPDCGAEGDCEHGELV